MTIFFDYRTVKTVAKWKKETYYQFSGYQYAKRLTKHTPRINELFENVGNIYWYTEQRTSDNITNLLDNKSPKLNDIRSFLAKNETDVKNKFIEAAEKIKFYQAVRHSMGKMRTEKTNFGTKLTESSGTLPEFLDEESCKTQAFKRISEAKNFTDSWNEKTFNEIYDSFIKKFNSNFMNNLDFLIYFQGKDFATSLQSILQNDLPLKNYYKFAKKKFDYNLFPDLIELRNLIQSKI